MGPPSQMSYQDLATALLQVPCTAGLQISVFPNCIAIAYLFTCLSKDVMHLVQARSIFKLSLKFADTLHGKSQKNLTSETSKGQAGVYGYNCMAPV